MFPRVSDAFRMFRIDGNMLIVSAALRSRAQYFLSTSAETLTANALTTRANMTTFRAVEATMTSVANLYLSGFSKPLGEWSERALEQVREDIEQVLGAETSPAARVDLTETLMVLDAEVKRRAQALTAEEEAALEAKGATRSFGDRVDDARDFIGKMRGAVLDAFTRGAETQREGRGGTDTGLGL